MIRAIIALVLLSALCGCHATGGRQPQPLSSMPSTSSAEFTLPFDHYKFSAADMTTIRTAQDRATARCLEAQGASPAVPRSAEARFDLDSNARRYGLIDAQTAQRYGYHVPPDSGGDGRPADERARKCEEEASGLLRRKVGNVDRQWLDALDFRSVDRSAAAPEVLRVTAEWSRCMQAAGFHYASPLEAISDARWRLDVPKISVDEIAVATTDVRCKLQTHLVGVRAEVESIIQRQFIAQNPARFAAIERANAQILANARSLLAG